ncbi:MAG: hypothetical protein GWP60_02830 [Gammaproteobacteria bacterium]|nr:hypothetical protein [Gammaproteobacteria bacterium]
MKSYSSMLLIAMVALLAAGCASAPPAAKSGVELQAYQAREFETSKRAAFSATLSVFQDLGFIIDDGDFETGLITATGLIRREKMDAGDLFAQIFAGVDTRVATQRRATAFVEEMPSGLVRIRLNFVDNMAMIQGTPHSAAIEDPAFYQATFELIDKAIFVRSATT